MFEMRGVTGEHILMRKLRGSSAEYEIASKKLTADRNKLGSDLESIGVPLFPNRENGRSKSALGSQASMIVQGITYSS
jgi:hypothetical protein